MSFVGESFDRGKMKRIEKKFSVLVAGGESFPGACSSRRGRESGEKLEKISLPFVQF